MTAVGPPRPGRRVFRLVIGLCLGALALMALLPVMTMLFFAGMPAASADFDCDDGVLWMYDRISRLGLKAIPFAGNLDATGEAYEELNHIWLLVQVGGLQIALDWGTPWIDRQHYEGYPVTYAELLRFVEMDLGRGQDGMASAPPEAPRSPRSDG